MTFEPPNEHDPMAPKTATPLPDDAPASEVTEEIAASNDDQLIDGFSLEELSEYLDNGRTPYNEEIEHSAECRRALVRLERLHELSDQLMAADRDENPAPESWFDGILQGISREVRAGRAIPIAHEDPEVELSVMEGTVRGLIRAAGDSVEGAIIEKTEFEGDLTTLGAPITVTVSVTAFANTALPQLAEALRTAITTALMTHAELAIAAVDVRITDIHVAAQTKGAAK
ncbi:hypothetical protein [Humidisolicoccus flavus]|uniref:hypothetical protein n=1 Tax=Humidisolicoccus flavus TaxID=3111414 RepID=UPI0032528074